MGIGSTIIALIIVSIVFGLLVITGLVWFIPFYIQKQKVYSRKKEIQKKVNDELVRNIRYRSPSTILTFPQTSKVNDYGATQLRQLEEAETMTFPNTEEKTEVPSIAITFDEEMHETIVSDSENFLKDSDSVIDKVSLINSKRRFSSIVFSHSDELKVLSDNGNLELVEEKRERRASMSLFETCKLACPELTHSIGQSTEHLNELILSEAENQGKLYFMLSQLEGKNSTLELVVIKVTDIVQTKKKCYQLQMELFVENSKLIYTNQTNVQACVGEVVNFDETFTIDINESIVFNESNEELVMVFSLIQYETKKTNKSQKMGEIRFDLLGLIEGQILCLNGQEQFVICRNFITLAEKEKLKENSGKALVFLRFSKLCPVNFVVGVVEIKDVFSSKPYNGLNIRITLASEGKVLDSRKSKVIKKKYQTEDGIFKVDESFEFNLALQKSILKENSKSSAKLSSQETFVTIFLCGRNNIGFSHVIGKCVMGPIQFADGPGLLHWKKANNNWGEIIYQWHYLKN